MRLTPWLQVARNGFYSTFQVHVSFLVREHTDHAGHLSILVVAILLWTFMLLVGARDHGGTHFIKKNGPLKRRHGEFRELVHPSLQLRAIQWCVFCCALCRITSPVLFVLPVGRLKWPHHTFFAFREKSPSLLVVGNTGESLEFHSQVRAPR